MATSGWARRNAHTNALLKAELGGKGWIKGHLVNPDGSIGGRRVFGGSGGGLLAPMAINVRWDGLGAIRDMLLRAAKVSPEATSRALNRTIDMARTSVTRALVSQTGLKYGRVRKATSVLRSSATSLSAELRARDGYTSLKDFSPRKTKRGVSAAPWGRRQVFPGSFIVKAYGGHVYKREGARRFPVQKLYGPAIPIEMLMGQSRQAFYRTVETQLPKRLDHELGRLFTR